MLFPIFVVVTLAEIYVLVSVGQAIGGLSTVLLVVITAFIGTSLLRQQGWSTMAKAQQSMAEGRTPAMEMLEGVVILVSGILLLTPGFLTDGPRTARTHAMEQDIILLTTFLKRMQSESLNLEIQYSLIDRERSDSKN
jgi:hypothetical protein